MFAVILTEEQIKRKEDMSSRSLNKVMLIGNLTRDPNLRYTPKNTAVCSFGLATNRSWTPSDGSDKQEQVEFHNIVAWSKLAELCDQLLHKGDKVYVDGRLQTRDWKGDDGKERRTTEVVIENMILLRSRNGVSSTSASTSEADVADKVKAKDSGETKAETITDSTDAKDIADDVPF